MSPLNPAYLAYDKFWRGKGGSEGSSPLEAALFYARRGWPVLPVWWVANGKCGCGKADCLGKHPIGPLAPHGAKDATCDLETIKAWWWKSPKANVAIATGPISDLLVLDIDPRHGGRPGALPEPMPSTPTVRTGGGGWHFYLQWPDGAMRLPKSLPGCPGVDLKGADGYVLAPPSAHVSGGCYAWEVPPEQVIPAPCPDWLLKAIAKAQNPSTPPPRATHGGILGTPYGRAALRREILFLAQAPVGERNNSLNLSAYRLGKLIAAGHLPESVVAGLLETVALNRGLHWREVAATLRSGLQAGMREGRT